MPQWHEPGSRQLSELRPRGRVGALLRLPLTRLGIIHDVRVVIASCSIAVVVLASCLALAPSAQAKRVALAGVRLGMTPDQVRDVLGRPKSTSKENVGGVYVRRWRYPDRLSIELGRSHGNKNQWRVERMLTFSPLDSFSNGVRVGSSLRRVRANFRPLACGPNGDPHIIVCQWFLERGQECVPQINFWLRRKRLYKIEVLVPSVTPCPRAVRS